MNRIRYLTLFCALAALTMTRPAQAQLPQAGAPTRPAQQDTAKPKTTREVVISRLRALDRSEERDTTKQDTVATTTRQEPRQPQAPPMDFPTDSVMRELMKLDEYAATLYRGSSAVFVADSDRLVLQGTEKEKAGVVRDGQTMTADSLLTFDESTSIACGYGNPVLSGDEADAPVKSQLVCFNTRDKIGMAMGARTQVSEGANWFITGDLYSRNQDMYAHNAKFTDCSLETPHYHFAAKDVKIMNNNVMVARNVTLNFGDVPVFWLPFMPQSLKQGRRSGVLMPDFSVNDIVRRSSGYRRRISNVGFYWAISESMGSRVALDWFSGHYTALEGSYEYNFPRQFFTGGTTVKRFWETTGSKQFTIATNQNWEPTERMSVRLDGQYASSTDFVEQQSYDPRELRRRITSNASLSRRFNWGSLSLQGSRSQDLSDDKVEYVLPSVGLNFATLTLFPKTGTPSFYNNATWTASAQLRKSGTQYADTDFEPSGIVGGVTSSFSMGKFSWSQSFDSNLSRGPVTRPAAGDTILAATQRMTLRSQLSYTQRLIGTTTFTPGISIAQEMERRDTLNGNQLIKGPMRIDANASLKMDLFGFWPGVGPMSRIRHRISPTLAYSYSPSPSGIDSLRKAVFNVAELRERNTISIGISQTIEGKYRESGDSVRADSVRADSIAADTTNMDPSKPRRLPQARKVTILSLNTDAVLYDFVAAREGETGVQTTQISNSLNSDLLRGLQLTFTHELFKPGEPGPAVTGKKEFDPHLQRVSASFSLNNNSWLFKMLGFGRETAAPPPTGSQETPVGGEAQGAVRPTGATRPEHGVIGTRERETGPTPRGTVGSWNASFNMTLERPRTDNLGTGITAEGNQMITSQFSFQPTPNWNLNWGTGFSFTTNKFSDHILTLTRQLHDWDANFNFIKAQNGNFSFVFDVKLRANPDIKFDYNQRSNVQRRQTNTESGF